MGKGYNNFMCKKPFHPGSAANIRRVWMAKQKDEEERKHQDELRQQYEKEQDLFQNRLLVSNESKDRLALSFIYEAPPGMKKDGDPDAKEEVEYKFEWQRNAPRESFAKNNSEIRDQPFGIQVRNVRCLKCHKWGHVNTDRECPLFQQSSGIFGKTATTTCPSELMQSMAEDGLAIRRPIGETLKMEHREKNEMNGESIDNEMAFINSLTRRQKKKLLKKLNKLKDL